MLVEASAVGAFELVDHQEGFNTMPLIATVARSTMVIASTGHGATHFAQALQRSPSCSTETFLQPCCSNANSRK